MKIKRIITLSLVVFCVGSISVSNAFSDLPLNHWAYEKVMMMQEIGIISGYSDGTFKPSKEVTREEFATILSKALNFKVDSSQVSFEDVENDRWSKQYIDTVSGYMDVQINDNKYYFNPSKPAIREEVAIAVVKAKGLDNEQADYSILEKITDVNLLSQDDKRYIAIAVKNGIMNGNANGTFNPKGALTRAEVAALMYNVLEKEQEIRSIKINSDYYVGGIDVFFSEGRMPISKREKDRKYGYIDKNGVEVIPCIYEEVSIFSENLAKVREQESYKYGYIDKNGNQVIPFLYDDALNFSEGLVGVKKNGKWGFIDTSGIEKIPFIYDWIIYSFQNGTALVLKGNDTICIDKNHNEVDIYTMENSNQFEKHMICNVKNGQYGFVDFNGNEIVPCIYDYVIESHDGFGQVVKNGKMGMVDMSGKEIAPCIYDNVELLSEELMAVSLNGKIALINMNGEKLTQHIYDRISEFSEGLASVYVDFKWGFLDETGKEVIPCEYEFVTKFSEGRALVVKEIEDAYEVYILVKD